jgi:hypothetical protein
LQASQPQPAALVFTLAMAGMAMHTFADEAGAFAAADCWQPQFPHSQTSQVQNSPLQSGHLQSAQPQAEFACLAEAACPANAKP